MTQRIYVMTPDLADIMLHGDKELDRTYYVQATSQTQAIAKLSKHIKSDHLWACLNYKRTVAKLIK